MDPFQQLLLRRRTTRKFSDELLTSDQTRTILEAALLSPTSKNRHSWEFIVVEKKDVLTKLSQCKPHSATLIAGAALAVVVMGNPIVSDAWIEDASLAAINMQLQAEALGLGSCWVQVRNRSYSDNLSAGDYINELLDVPMPMSVLCVIAIGHKVKERPAADLELLPWEKVHIDTYRNVEE
ncbi:MAG TPA: nitroreductase family protein [Proteiniphilum sp.]|nr:nitroreductase family protein [Proteiniphilum sp.]HPJ50246.1 nitroreductase family protein [Proteiniphilum sp.]HPR20912.1 nitroreductase family protein [Proteiniphilum sp.]